MRWGIALVWVLVGCASAHDGALAMDATAIGPGGASQPITFTVPEGARSITVVVEGSDDALFAVGSLVLSDGVERVAGIDLAAAVSMGGGITGVSTLREQVVPGAFVLQYPTLASQIVRSGPATLRVLGPAGAEPTVRVLFGDGNARAFHVGIVSLVGPLADEPPFVAFARTLLAQLGVDLVVDEIVEGPVTPALDVGALPRPSDPASAVLASASAMLHTGAFPIVVIELDGSQVFGTSRGVPASPFPGSHRGVFIDPTPEPSATMEPDRFAGRILAHELGHSLGLVHTVDTDVHGADIEDGLDDTVSFDDTVMGSVLLAAPLTDAELRFTPEQAFVATRSLLLE